MTHEACRERLVDLLYGELPPREARAMEDHLAACEACRAERDGLAAARAAMRRLPEPPPPERGDAALLAAARRAAEEQQEESFAGALRRFSGRLAIGTGLAAIAAYVLVTWSPGRGPMEIAPPPPVASDAVRTAPPVPAAPPAAEEAAPARPPPTAAQREKQSLRMDEGTPAPRVEAKGAAAARPAEPASSTPSRSSTPSSTPSPTPSPSADEVVRPERSDATASRSRRAPSPSPAAPSPPPSPPPRESEDVASSGAAPPAASREMDAAPMAKAAAPRPAARAPAAGAMNRLEVPALPPPGTALARDVESRHARGDLSDAQKRFPPCPAGGGDLRRLAWLDAQGHVRKLERERAGGVLVEEWFDEAAMLAEARLRGPGGWSQRLEVAPSGEERLVDIAGAPPPPDGAPPLVRRDPGALFFAPTGCDPAQAR